LRRKLCLIAFILIALGGLVFAQAKTSLNIQSNQVGARVYINDNLAGYTSPSFSTLVAPGLYRIRVSKDGFPEFKTTVVIGQSPITIVAYLGRIDAAGAATSQAATSSTCSPDGQASVFHRYEC